ncbi:hypothetical protein HB825_05520 [Listeria booriae]|nr:hypothetical protein [Listeria booriae]MBC2048234.1 hypothetical protein [Listeria booriae]MBC2263722.1 hypothetical protein [Listeria booriae]MBC6134296.1 hypothetical protein [Listeria booriae]
MSYLLEKYNFALGKWLPVKSYITRSKAEHARTTCIKKDKGKYRVTKNEQ